MCLVASLPTTTLYAGLGQHLPNILVEMDIIHKLMTKDYSKKLFLRGKTYIAGTYEPDENKAYRSA